MKPKKIPKVSVLTVSKRTGWEQIALDSLARQTFRDFEYVVVSEDPLEIPSIPAPPKTRRSNLSASNNVGIKNCSGRYIVFYQDFIELPPDCLEKLVSLADRNTFVTTLTLNPPGKEDDPRARVGEPVKSCRPEEWEENVAIAPAAILRYLGGYDEEYDQGWAWNNNNIACRAAMVGCKFLIDPTNNPQLIPHEDEAKNIGVLNGDFHNQRMADIEQGKFPVRLDYLTK